MRSDEQKPIKAYRLVVPGGFTRAKTVERAAFVDVLRKGRAVVVSKVVTVFAATP